MLSGKQVGSQRAMGLVPWEAAQALHGENCSTAVLCPTGVTVDPAARNVQILFCQYWWQVTEEPKQAQVKLTEAISFS